MTSVEDKTSASTMPGTSVTFGDKSDISETDKTDKSETDKTDNEKGYDYESDIKLVVEGTSDDSSCTDSEGFENLLMRRQALSKIAAYNLNYKQKEKYEPSYKTFTKCQTAPPGVGPRSKCKEPVITTEDMVKVIQERTEKDKLRDQKRTLRIKRLKQLTTKVEQQFIESAMGDLVDKFAHMMANKCIRAKLPMPVTGQLERMVRGLVCNMYWSLGMSRPNEINLIDYSVFETIAYCIVTMLLEANFQVHIYKETTQFSPSYYHSPDYYDYNNFYNNLEEYQLLQKCLDKKEEKKKKIKKKTLFSCKEMKKLLKKDKY